MQRDTMHNELNLTMHENETKKTEREKEKGKNIKGPEILPTTSKVKIQRTTPDGAHRP